MAKADQNTIEQINQWFHGKRDYSEGIALLEDAAPNMHALIKHLKRHETPEMKIHLTYQLFKISDHTNEKICIQPKVTEEVKKVEIIPVVTKENLIEFVPETEEDKNFLFEMVQYQKTCYNSRALLHKELEAIEGNSEEAVTKRAALLKNMDTFTQIVDTIFDAKITWQKEGIRPDISILTWLPLETPAKVEISKKEIDAIPVIDLQTELTKVRSRLSKYEKKIVAASGAKLEALQLKKSEDELLKKDLIAKIEAVKSK